MVQKLVQKIVQKLVQWSNGPIVQWSSPYFTLCRVKVDKNQKYRFKWRSTDLNEGLFAVKSKIRKK